jgi:hypothetical protein
MKYEENSSAIRIQRRKMLYKSNLRIKCLINNSKEFRMETTLGS